MFLAHVKQCLAPTLERGDIVIMDNLPVHNVAGVQGAIEAVGAKLLCLPPCSPDLNPIEMAFSKFQRAVAEGSRAHNSWSLSPIHCGRESAMRR